MKKLILTAVVASLAVAYPAVAGASTLKGTVVARQAGRHVLVVATSSGAARTVHTRNLARIGAVVSVTGTARADGTLTASSVRATGRASHARFRGVLLRHTAGLSFYSANRTVVAVHSRGRTLAAANDATPAAGTVANVGVAITPQGTLNSTTVTPVGQTGSLVIQATVSSVTPATATAAGSLVLSVNGQTLTIPLQIGAVLPATVVTGSTISLTLSFGANGATGQSAENDDEQGDQNDDGDNNDNNDNNANNDNNQQEGEHVD